MRWLAALLISLCLVASADAAGTRYFNATATSPGNRSGGLNFFYLNRCVVPSTIIVDSLGGHYRDNNDGADSVMVLLFDNDGAGGTPGTLLDSTVAPILVNNASTTTHTSYAKKSTAGVTLTAGDTVYLGTWVRAVTGAVGLARDGDNTSDNGSFLLDTIRLSNSADVPPLANPAAANSANNESAHCVFLVGSPATPTSYPTTLKAGTYKGKTIIK